MTKKEAIINGITTLKSLYKGEKLDKKIRKLFDEQKIPYDESLLLMRPTEIIEIESKLKIFKKGSNELIEYLSNLIGSPIYDITQLKDILVEYKEEIKTIRAMK